MIDLKGKNIIVTGASGGIGNSIVEKLNQAGANLLASGTRIEKLDELKNKFDNIKILKFDISQIDKIDDFVENATKELYSLRPRQSVARFSNWRMPSQSLASNIERF